MKKRRICPLCQAKEFSQLYTSCDRMFKIPGQFIIVKCQSCGLSLLNPQPQSQKLKKYYPSQKYYSYGSSQGGIFNKIRAYLGKHYYYPNFLSHLIATFVHNIPALPNQKPPGKILDIGCGAGETLLLLKNLGWDVYGLEIDQKAITAAKKNGLKSVHLGGYRQLKNFPDHFFDCIRLYHVIEHLDNPLLCLKLCRQKLKKDGELIIGTPNIASLAARLFGTYWYNLDSPRHLFLFRPNLLKKISFQSGLKPLRVEFCSAGGIIGSIQYLLGDKFRLNLDLIHQPLLVILFYPLEWLLDKLNTGDIFVLRATKAIG